MGCHRLEARSGIAERWKFCDQTGCNPYPEERQSEIQLCLRDYGNSLQLR